MLLITGAIIALLVFSGKAKTMNANQWLALAIALLGANFLRGGNWMMGGAMIAGAAFLNGWRILIPAKDDAPLVRKPRDFELDRARSLLGVSDDAGPVEINKAWQERLAENRPENGFIGEEDEQLILQINRARDILMEQMEA